MSCLFYWFSKIPMPGLLAADLCQSLDGGIDVLFGIEVAEAETDSAGRECTECLVCVRCAVQADSGLYAILEVQPECCISAVDAESLNGYDSCTSLDPLESDYLQLAGFLERKKSVKESLCESELVFRNGIKPA